MFAVNHLAYFTLTTLLADALVKGSPGIVLDSTGGIEAAGKIAFDDLQSEKSFSWFRGLAQSKLANVLFTYEAARCFDAKGIKVHCLSPGGVRTNLGQNTSGMPKLLMALGRPFFATPEAKARTVVDELASKDAAVTTGVYFGPKGKITRSSAQSYDVALAARLWEASAARASGDGVARDRATRAEKAAGNVIGGGLEARARFDGAVVGFTNRSRQRVYVLAQMLDRIP